MKLISKVPDFDGPCKPTRINTNQIYVRVDGGYTGFFKLTKNVWWWPWPVKHGAEFHGIIRNGKVYSTATDHAHILRADEQPR